MLCPSLLYFFLVLGSLASLIGGEKEASDALRFTFSRTHHQNKTVRISNIVPRRDAATGEILPVSDGSLVEHHGTFYLYGVKYQPCPVSQQATCYNDCGWYNNTFAVYVSQDLERWSKGRISVLPLMDGSGPLSSRHVVYFSPYVVFNPFTKKYVMWFQFNFSQRAVAISDDPLGPFRVVAFPNETGIPQHLRHGSSVYLWKDDVDDTAYIKFNIILRYNETGSSMFVGKLSPDYTKLVEYQPVDWNCLPPAHSDPIGANSRCFQEGGGFFKLSGGAGKITSKVVKTHQERKMVDDKTAEAITGKSGKNDIWFVLGGNGCCFCALGADTKVWRSTNGALGPYTHIGYLNPPLPNPPNATYTPYTIPAQQFGVHPITIWNKETGKAEIQPLYIGMRWGSAPDGLKDHDFQFWAPILAKTTPKIFTGEKKRGNGTMMVEDYEQPVMLRPLQWENDFELELW